MAITDGIKKRLKGVPVEHTGTIQLNRMLGSVFKRSFDIFAAAIGLAFLSPLFFFISIAIKRDSDGPVFFWCNRMGKNGQPFRMLKFRTMYERSSSYQGPPVTCEGDDRITPIGRWLRDTKINELPQLWNVLIGEMSLVGPRPEDVKIANEWPEETFKEVLSMRPGITSPASILYHDEEHLLSKTHVMSEYFTNIMPDKMRLDRLYVRNQSFSSDLDIIFWTFVIIIPHMAVAEIPEGLLFAGPFTKFVHRYANWFLIDFVTSYAVINALVLIWRVQNPLNWGVNHLFVFAFMLAVIFSGVNWVSGLSRIVWSRATAEDVMSLLLAGGVITCLLLFLNLIQSIVNLFGLPALPMILVLAIGMVSLAGFAVTRFRWRILTGLSSRWLNWRRNAGGTGERVLIVGAGEGFQTASWLLRREEFRYIFTIVGVVDDDNPTQLGMWVSGSLVLGGTEDIPRLVEKYDIGVILFTVPAISPKVKKAIFSICETCDLRIAFLNQIVKVLSQQMTMPADSLDHLTNPDDTLSYLASHDVVTGLPNRSILRDQLIRSLAYARRYKICSAVLIIQIEDFEALVEQRARKARNDLLKQVVKRILRFKRQSDTLAIVEEGCFGLILENMSDVGVIPLIAERINASISEPFEVNGIQVCLRARISTCGSLGDCAIEIEEPGEMISEYFARSTTIVIAKARNYELD